MEPATVHPENATQDVIAETPEPQKKKNAWDTERKETNVETETEKTGKQNDKTPRKN